MFRVINAKFMRIELKKFGDILISRPAGREAFLAMQAYSLKDVSPKETIEIDFSGVKVLTPSWADEVITGLNKRFKNIKTLNTNNVSVKMSLRAIRDK